MNFSTRLRIALNNLFLWLLLAGPLLAWWLRGQLRGIRRVRHLAYVEGGDVQQTLDVYVPRGNGPHPVVVYLHGGGFVIGSKWTHQAVAWAYARQGYLVFNIDYRTAPVHRFPAAQEDACLAYAWVLRNSDRFGGDVRRITVAGESAGGNLAASIMIACCYDRPESYMRVVRETGVLPAAVKLDCAYLWVSQPERYRAFRGPNTWEARNAPRLAYQFARAYLGREGLPATEQNLLADPLRVFETRTPARALPPVYIGVGEHDLLYEDSQRCRAALEKLQATVHYESYPGEQHVFHFLPWRRARRDFWRNGFAFLTQALARSP